MSCTGPQRPGSADVVVDAGRWPTNPEWVPDGPGPRAGDRLRVPIDQAGTAIVRSGRAAALRFMEAMHRDLAASGITEEEARGEG